MWLLFQYDAVAENLLRLRFMRKIVPLRLLTLR